MTTGKEHSPDPRRTPDGTPQASPLSLLNPFSLAILAIRAMRSECQCDTCDYLREVADQVASIPFRRSQEAPVDDA